MYAQEDLWVLTALMNIIKRTNGDARVRHNAKIKGIETIQIGKAASKRTGQIWWPDGEGDDSDDDIGGLPEPSGPSSSEDGEPGMREVPDPADERYVDSNYSAIDADTLITTPDPFMKVAKRMPVRMRLKIDQRAIVPLLIECANSELTVEVRQVRLNPPLDADGFGGSSRSSEEPGMALFSQATSERDHSWVLDPFPYDVTVEVYGIIYIFNEVDATALSDESGDDM